MSSHHDYSACRGENPDKLLDEITETITVLLGVFEESPLSTAHSMVILFLFPHMHQSFVLIVFLGFFFWKGCLSYRGRLQETNLPSGAVE